MRKLTKCDDVYYADKTRRSETYGALWMLCMRYFTGPWGPSFRILTKLESIGFVPSEQNEAYKFESGEQCRLYRKFYRKLRWNL